MTLVKSIKQFFIQVFLYIFSDAYEQSSKESTAFLASPKATLFDKQAVIIFISSAFLLSLFAYFGQIDFAIESLTNSGLQGLSEQFSTYYLGLEDSHFFSLRYWVWVNVVSYFLIPIFIIKVILKQSLTTYGMSLKRAFADWKLYLGIYLFMFMIMLALVQLESFQAAYPTYKPEPLLPKFLIWHVHFFMLYVSVEFFFRGFMLHGLKHRFGFYSVFIMTLPYCMVHFGKPLAETIGSIIAGVVLGALSLKTNSIWLGVVIHYIIGLTMDLLSLWQQGYF